MNELKSFLSVVVRCVIAGIILIVAMTLLGLYVRGG